MLYPQGIELPLLPTVISGAILFRRSLTVEYTTMLEHRSVIIAIVYRSTHVPDFMLAVRFKVLTEI